MSAALLPHYITDVKANGRVDSCAQTLRLIQGGPMKVRTSRKM